MENVSLKPSITFAGLGLILGLVICDVFLLVHSFHQNAVITGFADSQAASRAATLPAQGQSLPTIMGVSLKTGRNSALTSAGSPRIALLIFRESCHFCTANWKNWDKLFGKGGLDLPVVMVTADKTISQSYRDKHPMLNSGTVIVGVDAATLLSLRLGATPQTIYLVDGKINHDWAGVLSSEEMKEIMKSMSKS